MAEREGYGKGLRWIDPLVPAFELHIQTKVVGNPVAYRAPLAELHSFQLQLEWRYHA